MLDFEYLKKLDEFFESGDLTFEFEHGDEEKRGQILDFLEQLMDLAEKADALATKLIFPNMNQMVGGEEGEGEKQ